MYGSSTNCICFKYGKKVCFEDVDDGDTLLTSTSATLERETREMVLVVVEVVAVKK